jgi:hypothetical protein
MLWIRFAMRSLLLLVLAWLCWAPTARAGAASTEAGFPPEAAFVPAAVVGEARGAPLYRAEILSPVYQVDAIYTSMRGPKTSQYFTLDFALGREGAPPELLYVTGYRAQMKAPDGVERLSDEFMCHSNLDVDVNAWGKHFQTALGFRDGRISTLAQGQLALELPAGFGIPIMSHSPIGLDTQVLNHNVVGPPFGVRHRVQIEFQRAAELPEPLVPLVQRAVFGMALVEGEDGHFGVEPEGIDPELHGPGCLPADDAGGQGHHRKDAQGRTFTGFWMVPPGRQVNHTRVTDLLNLPYDTTVHYIAVHVHPFAESLELRDLTSGETVYKSRARQVERGVGLAEVEYLKSAEGIPVYKGHEYQLTSVYVNPTEQAHDSMAVMYMYLRARDLESTLARGREGAAP